MGKLLTTEAVNTPTGEKVSKRIIKKLDRVESSAQVIEYIDMATEPTQAESNAKEMINDAIAGLKGVLQGLRICLKMESHIAGNIIRLSNS